MNHSSNVTIRKGPDGILLFHRATGINLLIDDVELPKDQWAVAPRHVSIALTNACDLACSYCFAPKTPATLVARHITSWLDELNSHGCIGIGFGGGEPTLFRDLPSLCTYATQNTGLAVTFTTHGHHINSRLASVLKGNVNFIRVSMDGVGATYEKLRGRPFRSLLHQLEIIRDIAPFGINYLINELTLPEISLGIEVASNFGASDFLLLPERAVRGIGGISTRTLSELHAWVTSHRGSVPLSISEVDSDQFPICNPLPNETGLRSYAHIDASGVLKYSSFDEYGMKIGPGGLMQALRTLALQKEASL